MNLEDQVKQWTEQANLAGHDVFEKALNWKVAEMVEQSGFYPYFQALEENQGTVARYQGKEVIMLGSNNYLGLTTHPQVREASMQAIQKYGTGMTGSRFLNGTLNLHIELEEKIADFLGKEAALVFTTGYQSNLGMLTALIGKNSTAVVDRFAHASIHDGCRLMDGQTRRFGHNNLEELDQVLSDIPHDQGPLVCVDGVYSMEGDLAPLPEIIKITKKHEVRLAVDDAHGFGVLGPGGKGTCHHFGVEDEVDLIVGTFSKSLASTGGFVAGQKKVIHFIKHFGRPMIFSASLAPACVAAASTALDILKTEPERAQKCRDNALWMKKELDHLGFKTGDVEGAIVPVITANGMMVFMVWKELLDAGVYTNPVMYPAVAKGSELLRTSYLATHEEKHLVKALEVFEKIGKKYQLIP